MKFKFENLSVWKRAVGLSVELIRLANTFPSIYQYSLGGQLRRASLAIPTNIAEGAGRGLDRDQANFYRIAKGSVYDETNQIAAMLTGLMGPKNRLSRLGSLSLVSRLLSLVFLGTCVLQSEP